MELKIMVSMKTIVTICNKDNTINLTSKAAEVTSMIILVIIEAIHPRYSESNSISSAA